jgi:hypothetical protein
MTPEKLAAIEARIADPNTNWNMLVVQQDRNALLDEVKRLQRKLQDLTGVVPDPGGGEWVNGAYYDCKPCFECGETDQTHDFKCSKHPSNAVRLVVLPDPVDAMLAYHQYRGPEPITNNAVTGGLSREPECDYRGALAECHSLHCPVHGKDKP